MHNTFIDEWYQLVRILFIYVLSREKSYKLVNNINQLMKRQKISKCKITESAPKFITTVAAYFKIIISHQNN